MPTNFDLAPPSKTVDGLAAVAMDIQHIAATLLFDAATSSGSGDATLDFIVGPNGGCPIFDLRQTITSASLDGAPLTPGDVALHDFGGGIGAELRVLDQMLAGGSAHVLRLGYALGTPQASTAGSYQPALTWSSGPRLVFNFGFTDLGPGRYLESWVPANLIFDQFDVTLEIKIVNTPVPHTVITNGVVTSLGSNHWAIAFPARCTALSPLLELRATDTVVLQTSNVLLPISGANIALEACKLVTGSADLTARLSDIASFLAANEVSTGPYLHGNRFIAFLHQGGMEYDGGTTTAVGSLRHETFHSWWGRGLKPASQADGWWDEAWTVYNDAGASGSLAFDFSNAPVELSSRNPWVRVTPGASYSSGERFFRGVAALMGVANINSAMSELYKTHQARPITTATLEAHLMTRCAEPSLVDAFHRFVYGFADPAPAPDLWIKDNPGDSGSHLSAGTFWNSPDLWIRNADDDGTTHQPPESGQDNWFYARVRNRSAVATARHFVVTFNVKPWVGTEFLFPGDFLPCTAAVAGFDLGPGEIRTVKARWPRAQVPPAGTHVCWLAAVLTRSDQPPTGLHVWENNNLAQKNLTVIDAVPGQWIVLPFIIDRFRLERRGKLTLQIHRPRHWEGLDAVLLHRQNIFDRKAQLASDLLEQVVSRRRSAKLAPLDCRGGIGHEQSVLTSEEVVGKAFARGKAARMTLQLPGLGQLLVRLALRIPEGIEPGQSPPIDLVQWDDGLKHAVGGFTVIIRAHKSASRSSPAVRSASTGGRP